MRNRHLDPDNDSLVLGGLAGRLRRRIVEVLATGCTLAVATLIEIARGGNSEHARLNASLGLLSTAREWIEKNRSPQRSQNSRIASVINSPPRSRRESATVSNHSSTSNDPTMRSRVIEARLRRLASASKPAGADDEAAARQALHDKLDAMAARLHEDDQTDWGDVHLHVQEEEDVVGEHLGRLGSPSTTQPHLQPSRAAHR